MKASPGQKRQPDYALFIRVLRKRAGCSRSCWCCTITALLLWSTRYGWHLVVNHGQQGTRSDIPLLRIGCITGVIVFSIIFLLASGDNSGWSCAVFCAILLKSWRRRIQIYIAQESRMPSLQIAHTYWKRAKFGTFQPQASRSRIDIFIFDTLLEHAYVSRCQAENRLTIIWRENSEL